MKKVSIIIPCHNASKWLPKCFISLASQTMEIDDIEMIFVDDASDDGGATWNLLTECEAAFPDSVIIIHLEQNMRQGGARNEGLKYASGEYVSFVDSDDFVTEDFLDKVYARAKETDADIVQFGFRYYYNDDVMIPDKKKFENEIIDIKTVGQRKKFLMAEKVTYGCCGKLYKRKVIEDSGVRFAEHVCYEEPLFVYPLLFFGSRFVTMDEAPYFYRQNHGGTMHNEMKDPNTLKMHMSVQLSVWDFMKKTQYFKPFYEEIKLYFLHSYFYETLHFAKMRGFDPPYDLFCEMRDIISGEVPDYDKSDYDEETVEQMKLYRFTRTDPDKGQFDDYYERILK